MFVSKDIFMAKRSQSFRSYKFAISYKHQEGAGKLFSLRLLQYYMGNGID